MKNRSHVVALSAISLLIGLFLRPTTVRTQEGSSTEARLAALELKTSNITRGVNTWGRPYYQIDACVGINDSALCQRPDGAGAAFSVQAVRSRFAGYFEVTNITAGTTPTTAVYASVVQPNNTGQPSIAFEGHAKNNPNGGTVGLWADSQFSPFSPLGKTVTTVALTESDGDNKILRYHFLTP